MAQTYTRQSTMSDGDTITAALFNNEYNQLVNAFSYSSSNASATGHRHDGSAGQGGNIHTIGDLDFLNKIVVDSTNNRWGFFVEVSSSAVEQIRIQDGAIVPVTDNDIDLGTSSLEFKDGYFDGTLYADAINFNGTAISATAAELNILDGVTSTAAELNILDGVTSTTAELNILDGVTSTAAELNILDGVTATAAEINILDGVTSTTAELNILDGVTSTTAELNILDGVTSTAAELNILDGVTATATELNYSDTGSSVGTVVASKVVTVDSNKDVSSFRNITLTGELDAGSLDISGDADIDGTLETDALSINGTSVTATAAELNILDGVTSTAAELNILDGVTSTTAELNILDGVTATTAELNILDGVTVTAAEINTLDGITAVLSELNALDLGSTAVGTAIASKAVILDSNKDYTGIRNFTITGELDAATLDISGNVDIDGTTNLDVVDIDGAVDMASTLAVAGNVGIGVSSPTQRVDISGGGLQILGNISTPASGTSSVLIDYYSGAARYWARGADGSTRGAHNFYVLENDGGNQLTALSIDSSANATFAGNLDVDGTAGIYQRNSSGGSIVLDDTDTADASTPMVYFRNTAGQLTLGRANRNATTGLTTGSTDSLTISSAGDATFAGHVSLADSKELRLGGGDDLRLYHNGSSSYIKDVGTGNLYIAGSGSITFTNGDVNETYAVFNDDGAVVLKYDDSTKLSTASSGVDITGAMSATTISIGGTAVTSTAAELNVLDPALKENSSIWIGSDPSGNTGYSAAQYNVALGVNALDAITTADRVTAIGYNALSALTTGSSNTAVGDEALLANTSGNTNVAVGGRALTANTVGDKNTAVGYQSLYAMNPAGNADMYNTAVGYGAGLSLTTGVNNTLIGGLAGEELSTGSYNTHVGYNSGGGVSSNPHTGNYNSSLGRNALSTIEGSAQANTALGFGTLEKLTTASNNTAVGGAALQLLTTGGDNVAVGSYAGDAITSAGLNTLVGYASGTALTTSQYNVAVGHSALKNTTTGDLNIAIGYKALHDNEVGDRNTAIGYEALRELEPASNADMYNVALGFKAGTPASSTTAFTGTKNTLLGSFAGAEITTSNGATVVGYEAGGGSNTSRSAQATGEYNTAIGYAALTRYTSGHSNVAVGTYAAEMLTEGDQNVYVGNYAGEEATTAEYNAVVGYNAGGGGSSSAATGNYNAALGFSALQNTTTGTQNIAVGAFAMQSITEGDSNVAVGYQALDANTTGVDNVAIGRDALGANVDDDGSVAVGRNSLRVANNTGADAISYNTAVGTNSGYSTTLGTQNTLVGYAAGFGLTEGLSNTVLGINAGYGLTTGDNNLLLGKDAGRTGSPGGLVDTEDNIICLGDESISAIYANVQTISSSDARDKTDFTDLDIGLEFVKALKPVTYKWDRRSKYGDKTADDYDLNAQTPDGTHKEDWLDIGFKAQDVEALEVAAGYTKDNKTNLVSSHTPDGTQVGLQYTKFVPILVKAIQEQQALIESLTSRIAALEG